MQGSERLLHPLSPPDPGPIVAEGNPACPGPPMVSLGHRWSHPGAAGQGPRSGGEGRSADQQRPKVPIICTSTAVSVSRPLLLWWPNSTRGASGSTQSADSSPSALNGLLRPAGEPQIHKPVLEGRPAGLAVIMIDHKEGEEGWTVSDLNGLFPSSNVVRRRPPSSQLVVDQSMEGVPPPNGWIPGMRTLIRRTAPAPRRRSALITTPSRRQHSRMDTAWKTP